MPGFVWRPNVWEFVHFSRWKISERLFQLWKNEGEDGFTLLLYSCYEFIDFNFGGSNFDHKFGGDGKNGI